jgi:hypothetical protein
VLRAGNLEALVETAGGSHSLEPSAVSFFEVMVRAPASPQGTQPQLVLTPQGGEAEVVAGKGIKIKRRGNEQVVTIPAGKAGTLRLTVELRPTGGVEDSFGRREVRLAVALLADTGADAPRQETTFALPLADCGHRFHSALTAVYARQQSLLETGLAPMRQPIAGLPGRWLFVVDNKAAKPPAGKPAKKLKLASWGPDEAHILAAAGTVMANRGTAPAFARRGALEWISKRVMTDLALFMKQPAHPAICTGTGVMLDYFLQNSRSLRAAIGDTSMTSQVALEVARARTEAALAATPGSSDLVASNTVAAFEVALMPQEGPRLPDDATAKDLAVAIATSRLDAGTAASVRQASDAIGALSVLARLRDDGALSGDAPGALEPILPALASIEIAAYLEIAAQHYARIDEAIFGTMRMIDRQHAAACVCGP